MTPTSVPGKNRAGELPMKVKSILVIASLLLSLLLGLVLARQGTGDEGSDDAAGKRPLRIGLSLDTLKEARWTRDRDALVARANELGAQVTVLSANGDDNRQVADVESLVTSKIGRAHV